MTDEQRSQTGWIGVQESVVILARALRSRVCTLLMVVAAVVLTSPASSFQEQEQTPQAPPRFRAEVTAVLVDVLVLDEQGRPIAGLSREDFRVLEDGALQEIENFEIIDWSSYVGRAAPQGEPTAPEPGAVVNAFPRRFIFIINRQNARTQFIRRAKMALENFVVESMTDEDEALVLDMGLSTKVLQQFKDSKEETLQTIRKISLMEADLYRGTGSDLGTRNVYDTLESLGQGLGQFPGRKIVIFMSPELGRTQNLITYLEDTVDAFNQSNTTIYSIDINGVRGFGPASSAAPISSAQA
ncbi:MAG: VWA domain-containing protein, partial [Vicinamibacteria bacterium]